jgi:hypothetical protein
MYVSDRVRRAAEEYAARTLRLALHRRTLLAAVLACAARKVIVADGRSEGSPGGSMFG